MEFDDSTFGAAGAAQDEKAADEKAAAIQAHNEYVSQWYLLAKESRVVVPSTLVAGEYEYALNARLGAGTNGEVFRFVWRLAFVLLASQVNLMGKFLAGACACAALHGRCVQPRQLQSRSSLFTVSFSSRREYRC
jgi:hypothetical protein